MTFVKLKKDWIEFKQKNTWEKTGIVVDNAFELTILFFGLMFFSLIWGAGGLTLLWWIEKGVPIKIVESYMWIWIITPFLGWFWLCYKRRRKIEAKK